MAERTWLELPFRSPCVASARGHKSAPNLLSISLNWANVECGTPFGFHIYIKPGIVTSKFRHVKYEVYS